MHDVRAIRSAVAAVAFLVASACAAWYTVRIERAPVAVDLAQPLAVVTNWHAASLLPLAALFAYAIIAFAFTRARVPSLYALAIALACTLLTPLVFSSDVYAYAAYGAQLVHGANPYAHAAVPSQWASSIAFQWPAGLPPSVYGPAFVVLSGAVVATFEALGHGATLFALRVMACIALLVTVAAFARKTQPGAALLATHPLLIWSAAEGHNDLIALALVALAWTARNGIVAAALLFAGGSVKLTALVGLLGRRLPPILMLLAAMAAISGAALAMAFGRGGDAPHVFFPQVSAQALGFFAARLAQLPAASAPAALLTALLAAAFAAARCIAAVRDRDVHAARVFAALGIWALIPNPQPWYGVWLVALAALEPERPLSRWLSMTALAAFLRYVPDAWGVPSDAASLALAALATAPLVGALLQERRRLTIRRSPRT